MDDQMTHERCSELLAGYVRGDLPRDLAGEVRDHLAECADCRAEERALAAMAAPPSAAPMDDLERARLHRGLAQELFSGRATADVVGVASNAPRWAKWVAPAAAAAAVLAGIVVVTNIGGGTDEDVAQLSAEAEVDGGADGGDRTADAQAPAPEGAKAGAGGTSRSLGAAADQESLQFSAAAVPRFDARAGTLTNEELSDIGRSGDLFRSFVNAYAPSDAPDVYEEHIAQLARDAGDARVEVEECAATLPRDDTTIPVYGALGEYDGTDALVLGFVTSDPGSDALDRYVMWVWARGDCSQPIYTLFEEIE